MIVLVLLIFVCSHLLMLLLVVSFGSCCFVCVSYLRFHIHFHICLLVHSYLYFCVCIVSYKFVLWLYVAYTCFYGCSCFLVLCSYLCLGRLHAPMDFIIIVCDLYKFVSIVVCSCLGLAYDVLLAFRFLKSCMFLYSYLCFLALPYLLLIV